MKNIAFPCLVQEVTDLDFRVRDASERKWGARYLVKAKSYGPDDEEASRVSIFYTTHTAEELPKVGATIVVQVVLDPGEDDLRFGWPDGDVKPPRPVGEVVLNEIDHTLASNDDPN